MNQATKEQFLADILIVDDRPNNLKLLLKILADYNYKVRCAVSGAMALQATKAKIPDLILLDITMPDMDGYQLCLELKKDLETNQIPIIFISALDATFDKVKAFQVGGADYISKPFEIAEVIARIKNQLQLQHTRKKLEQFNQKLEEKVAQRTSQLQWEVNQRRQAQEKLMEMAMHDPLTKLANRNYLQERLQTNIDIVRQSPQEQFYLLFLGCDRFQRINDSFGHLAGDKLLIAISERLQSIIPQDSFLARFGGDEFIVVLEAIKSVTEVVKIVEKIQQEFSKSIQFGSRECFLNLSMGIVLGTADYNTPEELLRDADIAMHQARQSSTQDYKIFDAQMHQLAVANLALETDLQRAIEKGEFVLYYQPIVCLKSKKIVSVEALIRWGHPERGLIPPNKFIPLAEETNLIIPLGMWVIREACFQLAYWQKQNSYLADLDLELNISVKQLAQPDFLTQIETIVAETGIDTKGLNLEITETIFMEQEQAARRTFNELKNRGFELILDDFGTGYSSLKYLQQLPISTIKIDRVFVRDLEHNINNRKIVEATINLAHTLGLKVVAEGIETSAQETILSQLDCDLGQGYFFAKPLEVNSLEDIVVNLNNK